MKIRALDVLNETEAIEESKDLDTVLDITVDDALRLALSNSIDGTLSPDWYEKILSKLGETEQNAFTMGLATEGIKVLAKKTEKNDLKKKKKVQKNRNEKSKYQENVKDLATHPNIKNLKLSVLDKRKLVSFIKERERELQSNNIDIGEEEIRVIATNEVLEHVISCVTSIDKENVYDKFANLAEEAIRNSKWVRRCLRPKFSINDLLQNENFVMDAAETILTTDSGIWDGRWDKYFGSENAVWEVSEDIKMRLFAALTPEEEDELTEFISLLPEEANKEEVKRKIEEAKNTKKKTDPVEDEIDKVASNEFFSSAAKIRAIFGENTQFLAYVAKSDAQKQRGLEVFSSLKENEAMFFPFEKKQHVTFHMGSVSFPIDIVFLKKSSNNTYLVTKIIHNAQPDTDETWSENEVNGVLETNGNMCKESKIKVGDECLLKTVIRSI